MLLVDVVGDRVVGGLGRVASGPAPPRCRWWRSAPGLPLAGGRSGIGFFGGLDFLSLLNPLFL